MSLLIGPLPSSDPRFMRRVRVHQAWYRAVVLGVAQFGNLAVSGAPCGSVLPDEAAQGFRNFHGTAAINRYRERRAKGWGVDPVRCTKYMTSSQALSFNMLAEPLAHPGQCAAMFNGLLGRSDLAWLQDADFEFAAQGSEYSLGDKTLVDVMLRFRTTGGGMQVVAVETKLADRFSTRLTSGMNGTGYRQLEQRAGLWMSLDAALAGDKSRQLARCHALAESIQSIEAPADGHASLLVLTHPDDHAAARNVACYRAHVRLGAVVAHRTWTDYLVLALSSGAIDQTSAEELSRRYVDLSWSEQAWSELDASDRVLKNTRKI